MSNFNFPEKANKYIELVKTFDNAKLLDQLEKDAQHGVSDDFDRKLASMDMVRIVKNEIKSRMK